MLNARLVWKDEIAALAIAENTDDRRVSAAENPHDAALGASRGSSTLASRVAAFDTGDNLVAVHGIAQLVRRNEEVAIEIRPGRLWNDEAVTIAMCD